MIEPVPGEPTRWYASSRSNKDWLFIVDSDYEGAGWACGLYGRLWVPKK